jgi:hypothetical protein
MKTRILFVLLFTVVLSMTLIGCGGSSTPPPPPPPQITVAVSPLSASLNAAGTQQFTATVTGTTSTAVTWSCTGTGCGTIDATGLYTAPSRVPDSGTVAVKATLQSDSTKAGSATVTHVPVKVTVGEKSVTLVGGDSHQLSASVTGSSNKAVTWTLDACSTDNCGSVDASGMYSAPNAVSWNGYGLVTATSVADPTKSDTVTVNLMAISLTLAPPGGLNLSISASQDFIATINNDGKNAGVIWSLDASCTTEKCGTLSSVASTTVKYTAPASVPDPATVNLTATSVSDSRVTRSVTISIRDASASLLQPGDYAFAFTGWAQLSHVPSRIMIVGRFHADAIGNITDGIQDTNSASGVSQSEAFTGSYAVDPNRRGTLTLTTATDTYMYHMVVDPTGTKANIICCWNKLMTGSGTFEQQTTTDFSAAALAGSYAFQLTAKPNGNSHLAAVGRVTVNAAGTFSSGLMDMLEPQSAHNNLSLTGSMTSPSTGRGTASITVAPQPGTHAATMNFAYYVVSKDKLLLMQTDTRSSTVIDLSGEFRRQAATYSTASLGIPSIFRMEGMSSTVQTAMIGQLSFGGNGNLTGIRDQNVQSTVVLNQTFTGTYAVDASGRTTIGSDLGTSMVGYLFGGNEGYIVMPLGSEVLSGSLKPQSGGPFSPASLAATYRHGEPGAMSMFSECDNGITTFDGSGAFSGEQDYSFFTTDGYSYDFHGSSQSFSGSYTMESNGRGTVTIGGWPLVVWAVSPDDMVAVDTASSNDSLPVLLQYVK